MILTLSQHAEKLEGLTTPLLCLDRIERDIEAESDARLSLDETGHPLSEPLLHHLHFGHEPAAPRACQSSMGASATSSGSRPRSTAIAPTTGSIRA